MNRTRIGRHRPIAIGPMFQPLTHLISPNLVSMWCHLETKTNEDSHICLHYRVGCSHTCAERTSWVALFNTRVRSCAEAVEQDLLVAYPVIDICAIVCICTCGRIGTKYFNLPLHPFLVQVKCNCLPFSYCHSPSSMTSSQISLNLWRTYMI